MRRKKWHEELTVKETSLNLRWIELEKINDVCARLLFDEEHYGYRIRRKKNDNQIVFLPNLKLRSN